MCLNSVNTQFPANPRPFTSLQDGELNADTQSRGIGTVERHRVGLVTSGEEAIGAKNVVCQSWHKEDAIQRERQRRAICGRGTHDNIANTRRDNSLPICHADDRLCWSKRSAEHGPLTHAVVCRPRVH
mgnify:CR=1 FL=1